MGGQCSKCGADVDAGDGFCGECGNALVADTAPSAAAADQTVDSGTVQAEKPSAKMPTAVIVALALLAGASIAGIGLIWIYYNWDSVSPIVGGDQTSSVAADGDVSDMSAQSAGPDAEQAITPEQAAQAAEEAADEVFALDAPAAESAPAFILRPGRWDFSMETIDTAIESNGNMPIFPDGQNIIGRRDGWQLCLSQAQARDPASGLVGLRDLRQTCSQRSASFQGGNYTSVLNCQNQGVTAAVSSEGRFGETRIDATSTTRVPTDTEFGPDHLLIINKVVGTYSGPC